MTTYIIPTSMPKEEIIRLVRNLPGIIVGTQSDDGGRGIRNGFLGRMALEFYRIAADEFDRNSRSESGNAGNKWAKNTQAYLAYGKGTKYQRAGRGQMPMNLLGGPGAYGGKLGRGPGTGFLRRGQLKQWWGIYGPAKSMYLLAGVPLKLAKAKAAQDAWNRMPYAKRKFDVIGEKQDRILVDKGILRKSLLPNTQGFSDNGRGGGTYLKGHWRQVFKKPPRVLQVGTTVPYAKYHHHGNGKSKRQLWPHDLPNEWVNRIAKAASASILSLANSFRRG